MSLICCSVLFWLMFFVVVCLSYFMLFFFVLACWICLFGWLVRGRGRLMVAYFFPKEKAIVISGFH